MALKTDYKEDVLDTSANTRRRYRMINNSDGTVSFEDATKYTQVGDTFGAADINNTNSRIEEVFQLGSNVKAELVTALQYSGLGITAESTWEEVYEALAAKFPKTLDIMAMTWRDSGYHNRGIINSVNEKRMTIVTTEGIVGDAIFESPLFDLTGFKMLNLVGSIYRTKATNDSNYYHRIYLVSESGVKEELAVNSSTGVLNVDVNKNIASYNGKYKLQFVMRSYDENTYLQNNSYISLTMANLTA